MTVEKEKLSEYLAELDREAVFAATETLLADGATAREIISRLLAGMELVNSKCEAGEYFISDLIMANHIYREAMDRVMRGRPIYRRDIIGRALLGTVQGDIHELGKNLISIILQNGGFETVDLGADVSPERFVSAVLTCAPDVLILSGTISGSEIMMEKTVEALKKSGVRDCVHLILGGNCVTEEQAMRMGADAYSESLIGCLGICRRFVLKEE